MTKQLFCIYDRQAKNYGPPMVAVNTATATRDVRMVARANPDAVWVVYPQHFDLVLLGQYDDDGGQITSAPQTIAPITAVLDGGDE